MEDKQQKNIPSLDIKDYGVLSDLIIVNLEAILENQVMLLSTPHRINYYELILITEGNGTCFIDGERFSYGPKTLIAFAKYQVASIQYFSKTTGHAILFSEEYIYSNLNNLDWLNNMNILSQFTDHSPIQLDEKEFIDLLYSINVINSENKKEDNIVGDEIIYHLVKTFILLCERIKRTRINDSHKETAYWNHLHEFRKKLEENYYTNRSVTSYADLLSITPKKLNQITNSYWGKSTKRVIEERLLLEIKRLLVHTDQSIKEIGYSLGFYDPTNFNKFCKKNLKMTPTNYRTFYKNQV